MNHLMTITKSDGTKELFEEEKLVSSLKRVGAKPEVIEAIVDEVEKSMREGATTTDIYRMAFVLLRKHATHVAVRYSVRRALAELGPDGFPFEKFVARIFQTWGYEAITDQQVMGSCIEHEVDVVAWKGQTLAMVEAKFHNELVLKSDVKVALYIKARFDDIAQNQFNYGGMTRSLTERWLFTNTKFTEQAIKYGTCNLKMIGWNFPEHNNLHEIIEKYKLFPITCITHLTHNQKRDLVARGIILCTDAIAHPDVLKSVGLNDAAVQIILAEAHTVVNGVATKNE
jgi:hypothetical protein